MGGPYLREVHQLTAIEAGNVLFTAVLAYQVGVVTFGPMDRVLDTRKWIAIGGTATIVLLIATLAIASHPPVWLAAAAIVGIGFFAATSTMVMTHGRGIFPDRLIGRGMATINTAVMFGVACMQTLSGLIIGAFERMPDGARSEESYRALFGVLTVVLITAIAIYATSRDIKPSEEMRARQT